MKQQKESKLKTISEEEMKEINKVAKSIIVNYGLGLKDIKTVFSVKFYNNHISNLRQPELIYERSKELLNNKDKIEEYFNEHPELQIGKDTFIDKLRLFNESTTPKAITEKEEAERQKEEAERQKEEAERQKAEATERAEKAERKSEEAQQAYTDNREDFHQKLSYKTNEIKALTEENEKLKEIVEKINKAPLKREYINDKVFNESYSLDKGELMDIISKDINKGKLPSDADPEEIADAIYAKATRRIYRNLKRINNLTALTGYNPDLYNKLPPEVAEIIKNHINEKINDDIRRKNIKYILPKDKPRWEHAMESKQLNPMLGRSAWRVN